MMLGHESFFYLSVKIIDIIFDINNLILCTECTSLYTQVDLDVRWSRWSTRPSTLRTYIVFECSLSKLFKLFFCVGFHLPKLAASSWLAEKKFCFCNILDSAYNFTKTELLYRYFLKCWLPFSEVLLFRKSFSDCF